MSAADILAQPLCALAFCWRIERRDGATIGLTSHDRALRINGLEYSASPGVRPSAIRQTGTLEASVMEVEGALASDLLSPVELAMGRWDGARVLLHLTEWNDPGTLWLLLAEGQLGAVRQSAGTFQAELLSRKTAFDRAVVPLTAPMCRARLGDADCRVDLAPLRRMGRLGSLDGDSMTVSGLTDATPFALGRLRWLNGPRCGLWEGIAAAEGGTLVLEEAPSPAPPAGTLLLMEQGCDRRMATCSTRFANGANFRGEPYLPGNDLLTRYPGAG